MKGLDRHLARHEMPLVFNAFFGRFGRLTPIQSDGMSSVLAGRDTVLVAPAASGKTEAAIAPLCERLLRDRHDRGVGILYVVPTRGLANDLEYRLKEPAASLSLVVVVRTSDHPVPIRDRLDILITTPESFDSLLCRNERAFRTVRAVVIDEAHELDRNTRGDQLSILMRRLFAITTPSRPQCVAMSATPFDPEGLARRLFGANAIVIEAGLSRPVSLSFYDDLVTAVRELRREGLEKALVFCNSRRRVESAAAEISSVWPKERVMVHHGSLSRRERLDVERAFRWYETAILVCTETLEVGVDIGDVDAVVLVGAPPSASSFWQRVGRGCRRKGQLLAFCVAEDALDREMVQQYAARDQSLPVTPHRADLSVAVQQIFSILYSKPNGVRRSLLLNLLEPLGTRAELEEICAHLVKEGFIAPGSADRLFATSRLMDMGERGRIHSNIPDTRTVKVRDYLTGREIGEVFWDNDQTAVVLGGKKWRKVGFNGSILNVTPCSDGGEATFSPRTNKGAFSRYLPKTFR